MSQRILPKRISDLPSCLLARLAGWSLLFCMGVGIVGIPLPESKTLLDLAIFPCMDCPCGCNTATQCWDECCCYSDSQKIAWAKSHGVEPPEFLVSRCANADNAPPKKSTCCCCSSSSCCQSKSDLTESCSGSVPGDAASQPEKTTMVLWQSAQRCKGIDLLWNLLSHGWLPNEAMPDIALREPPFLGYLAVINDSAVSFRDPPDPPVA